MFAARGFGNQCLFQNSNDVLGRFAVAVGGKGFFEFVEGDARRGQRFGFEQEAVILAVEAEVVVPEEVQRCAVGRGLRPESSIVVGIYPPAVGNGGRGKWQGAAVGDISRGNRYYYPDGRIMAFEDLEDADNFELLYYRADGSPLMHFRTSEDDGSDRSTWNANGDYVAEEEVQAEIDAVTARKEELQSAVRSEMP